MKSKLTDVFCTYTGGGIYLCTAHYNNEAWLAIDNESFGSYDCPLHVIEEVYNYDYDGHWKLPSVPLPTWKQVLNAIIKSYNDGISENMSPSEVKEIFRYFHSDLNKRLDEE